MITFSKETAAEIEAIHRSKDRYEWAKSKTLLPRRCYYTGKIITPMTQAYVGTRTLEGPGAEHITTVWATSEALMMEKLGGNQ